VSTVVWEWKQSGISGVCGAEAGLHHRDKSGSVQRTVQTCRNIRYNQVTPERV